MIPKTQLQAKDRRNPLSSCGPGESMYNGWGISPGSLYNAWGRVGTAMYNGWGVPSPKPSILPGSPDVQRLGDRPEMPPTRCTIAAHSARTIASSGRRRKYGKQPPSNRQPIATNWQSPVAAVG